MSKVLELKNLSYVYGTGTPFEKTAVNNLSLSIEKGEFIGIMGHTGSGKSTLVQMLNGLMKPTSGQVLLSGQIPRISEKSVSKSEWYFSIPNISFLKKPLPRISHSVLRIWARAVQSLKKR